MDNSNCAIKEQRINYIPNRYQIIIEKVTLNYIYYYQ